ncbi:hypothetical protein YA163_06280 [Tetragenococcus halophilus]|nr:hypothetical protein YA163_06280 [Tetragenococcus halophilus]GFK28289.1 hypothetical protein YG2_07230 [Tetragenococcus halophilus]
MPPIPFSIGGTLPDLAPISYYFRSTFFDLAYLSIKKVSVLYFSYNTETFFFIHL